MMNNVIRNKAKQKKVRLWEIAEEIGITDSNFSRKLRRELPQEETDRILHIIDVIADKRSGTATESEG